MAFHGKVKALRHRASRSNSDAQHGGAVQRHGGEMHNNAWHGISWQSKSFAEQCNPKQLAVKYKKKKKEVIPMPDIDDFIFGEDYMVHSTR